MPTPTHCAARNRSLKITELLLAHDANVNLKDSRCNSVLHLLAQRPKDKHAKADTGTPRTQPDSPTIRAGRLGEDEDEEERPPVAELPVEMKISRSVCARGLLLTALE